MVGCNNGTVSGGVMEAKARTAYVGCASATADLHGRGVRVGGDGRLGDAHDGAVLHISDTALRLRVQRPRRHRRRRDVTLERTAEASMAPLLLDGVPR